MRKIVFLLVLTLSVVSCRTHKSSNPDYKSLKEFGTDTLAFFEYNFKNHKNFYVGKEMSYVINDMGKYASAVPIPKYDKQYKADCIKGITLFLEPWGDIYVSKKGYSDRIIVWFYENEYLLEESYYEKMREERSKISKGKSKQEVRNELNHKLRDYFFLDKKVKDIEVFRIDTKD